MAVTWAASAPHSDAVKAAGSSFGVVGVVATLPNFGGKRRVLSKLTATGTYSTGGDAFSPALVGLREVHAVQILSTTDADFDLVMANATDVGGAPQFDLTSFTAPKIKLVDKTAELTAADVVTGTEFHAVFVGV